MNPRQGPRSLRAALIGHPVGHSVSPALHRAAGAACGIAVEYDLVDVPPGAVAAAVSRLRARGLNGINITAPHKAEALASADRLTATARAIGVVNTLVFGPDGVVGDNTDGPGFRAALEAGRRDPAKRSAILLGAGGAARAVAWALLAAGFQRVDVLNRTAQRAADLCVALDNGTGRLHPGPLTDASRRMAGADLLVDSLPGGAAVGLGLPFDVLDPAAQIISLDYGRRADPLRRAVDRRRVFGDGLPMLAWQGVFAFARWTGVTPPIRPVLDALRLAADAPD